MTETEIKLFDDTDHAGRSWRITARPGNGQLIVTSALAAQVATHCLPHWFIPIPIPQPPQGDPLMQCGHPDGCTCVLLHGFTHPDPLCAWASARTQPPQGGEVEP